MRLFYLALAALPLPAFADTFTISSTPTAVTIYNDFAMVTRDVVIDVGAGAHELVLPDLPQWIDADSLRVTLAGAALGGTRLRTDALPPQRGGESAAVSEAKARIDAAERALTNLADAAQDAGLAARAAEARLTFLQGLSSSATLPSTSEALAALGQMIEAQTLEATQAQIAGLRRMRDIEDGRKDLEEELADARAALAALTPPAEPKTLLALSITAAEAGQVLASISYPVNAAWQPTYDVVLTRSDADAVTLRRAALITQNSGENWENVSLTLSTLSPSGQIVPSELYPPLVRFEDPQERAKVERSMNSLSADATGAPPVMMEAEAPQPNFDGPGVTYTLPTPLSVARDAEGARIELDALEFDARVFARAVPARDSTAFLMAEATNQSMEPLLAARRAQIYVDGTMVGQSGFEAVPAGGTFTQAFGPLEELQLTHIVLDRSEGDRGLISRSNAQTQEVLMTVENLGTKSWNIEVREALPYSEQDDLMIEWTAQPQPSATDVEDRRGLVQWDISLAANASQDFRIAQTIRWPDGTVLR